jgi:hypothetical protein
MISTGCEGCCFLKQDDSGRGCTLNQACLTNENGQIFAPGYCRLCRSHKWAKKQNTTDLQKLTTLVLEDNTPKFDMIVFFDEAQQRLEDLQKTLNDPWYEAHAKRVIIADVTGFGNRKNLALQYLKSREHVVPTIVDSSAANEPTRDREQTIRRISKQVKAPFFLTIPAGKTIKNFLLFVNVVKHVHSRVIHWSLPLMIGSTSVMQGKLCYGLFATAPYRALVGPIEADSFTETLRKEECETEMGLSWFCQDCYLI